MSLRMKVEQVLVCLRCSRKLQQWKAELQVDIVLPVPVLLVADCFQAVYNVKS